MNEAAALSVLNTAGTELPSRSRTMTTTLRLPFWLRRKRRSRRFSLQVGGLHVAAEIAAIDLGHLAFAADNAALHFLGHRLAQLVQQHERALVGHAQIAAESASALLPFTSLQKIAMAAR